ncbi:cartilage matrix protein-like [Ruditapes philippinarum]|uniref:cartilage matrix protein-like n=1 Tax=Ruditapes philippinarum TaxID=129788 RepID=UPI00295BA8CC|nr:cartilage matrix protein-like [Ruditapes philippinarum]
MMHAGITCVLASLLVVLVAASDSEPDCGGKPADVFFALDSSGSLSSEDFEKELRFTQNVASVFDLDDDKVRVGLITFSKTVTPHFGLGDYKNRGDLFRKISDITWEGYGTNTGEALNYLHTKGFAEKNTRPGIPHIAIILTDGNRRQMYHNHNRNTALHDA